MSLFSYIKQEFTEEQYLKHNVLPFAENLMDKRLQGAKRFLYAQQLIFNEICHDEIIGLAKAAENNGIKMAFMKGLILAKNIYTDPALRTSSDIDILISPSDLKQVLAICKHLGYTSKELDDFDHIDESIDQYLNSYMHHFPIVVKQVSVNGQIFSITLEIHTYVYIQCFHQVDIPYKQVTESALQSAVTSTLPNFSNVYVLNAVDELLNLILHTVKHLFYDILASMKFTQKPRYANLRQFLDIEFYLQKYSHEIDSNQLLQRAIEWDVVPELVFMMQILNAFQSDCTINFDMKEYYTHNRPVGFFAYAIKLFLCEDLKEMLFMSSWDLAKYVLDHIDIDFPIIECHKSDTYNDRVECQFLINQDAANINNHFHTHYREYRRPDPGDWRCRGFCRYDDHYLFLYLNVEDDEFLVEDGLPHDHNWVDCLELLIVNFAPLPGQAFIRNLDIHLCINSDRESELFGQSFIYVREYDKDSKDWIRWDPDWYTYTFDIQVNTYTLELGIKWDAIQTCIKDNAILFDINVNDCDNKPPEYQCRLAWASNLSYCGLHDVSSFGLLKII